MFAEEDEVEAEADAMVDLVVIRMKITNTVTTNATDTIIMTSDLTMTNANAGIIMTLAEIKMIVAIEIQRMKITKETRGKITSMKRRKNRKRLNASTVANLATKNLTAPT